MVLILPARGLEVRCVALLDGICIVLGCVGVSATERDGGCCAVD